MKLLLTFVGLALLTGCRASLPIDPSKGAVIAGDVSLIQTACSPVPSKGLDVCRFHKGDPVTSSWTIYAPWGADAVGGEVRIRQGDQTKTYDLTGPTLSIPWSDIYGKAWFDADAGLAQAIATVRFKDRVVQSLGYAFIVILQPGYDPTPMGSNLDILYKDCIISYTSAGRSNVVCTQQ